MERHRSASASLVLLTRFVTVIWAARDVATALVQYKPDPYVLSSNLRAHFGREAFISGVRALVHRLRECTWERAGGRSERRVFQA